MAGEQEVVVEVACAFGSHCGAGLRDAALFGDDVGHHVLHPVGRHVLFRHVDTGEASFLDCPEKVEAITACGVSRDRGFLAVCERCTGEPHGKVSVYDMTTPLRQRKGLDTRGAGGRLVAICFSSDSPPRLLCAASIGQDLAILVIEWQSDRVLGRCTLGSPVDRVVFSPHDVHQLSASGPHIVRTLRLRDGAKARDGALKLAPVFQGLDEAKVTFTDHAWAEPGDGLLVTCTAEGLVYILSSQDLSIVMTLEMPFQDSEGLGASVPFTVRCFSQGFVLGGSEGTVAVWERVDSPPDAEGQFNGGSTGCKDFRHVRTMKVRQTDASVCSIDVTGAEESLVVGFRNSDIGYMSMASLYIGKGEETECCVVFAGGFHSGPISGLDMAVQRPLVASVCKKDRTLRIWNYATKQCDLRWEFAGEVPTAVAIHPFGYFVAISFSDKLRFFQILVNELKLYREFSIRGVRLVRFSNGGHFLVAAQGKNVHVFATRTVSRVTTLAGHAHHVKAVCFDPEDHTLASCGEDGTLCEWRTQTWEKAYDHNTRSAEYIAVSCSSAGDAFCSVVEGTKCSLKRFKQCALEATYEIPGHVRCHALCNFPGSNVLFGASSSGAVWVFPSSTSLSESREFGLHAGPCSFLCLSVDGRTLVTAGDDGALFVLNVAGLAAGEEGERSGMGDIEGRAVGAEVVLINRGEIQQKQDEFQLLHAENTMLKTKLSDEAEKLEDACRTKVAEARQRDQAEISELSRRCESLRHATTARSNESERMIKSMETSHNEAAEQLEHLYEKKLEHEADRFVDLTAEKVRLEGHIDVLRSRTERMLEEEWSRAKEELQRVLAEKDVEIQKHKDLIAFTQYRFESMLDQEAAVHDLEVAEMKVRSHEELKERRRVEADLRREQETLLLGLDEMEKVKERIEKEQQEGTMTISNFKAQLDDQTRTVKSLKAEKRERESTLHDKGQKIDAYSVKVNTLKKFRHILDQQLREVTQSLEPKDRMIDQLKRHLKELECEFERQLIDQRSMESDIEQKQQQIEFLKKETKQLRGKIKEKDTTVSRFTRDLHNLVTGDIEIRCWPQEIRRIYHVHVCGLTAKQDRLPIEEIQRQMRLMERKVTSLAAKGLHMEATGKMDIQRKSLENATLVHELNELRVQKKSLQSQARNLQLELDKLDTSQAQAAQLQPGRPPPAIENHARRRVEPLPPAGVASMPKTPSSGSLPGPRQRTQSPVPSQGGSRRLLSTTAPPQKLPEEVQKRMQSLLLTADINSRQIQHQKEESRILRDQIETLLRERHPNAQETDAHNRGLGTPSRTTATTSSPASHERPSQGSRPTSRMAAAA